MSNERTELELEEATRAAEEAEALEKQKESDNDNLNKVIKDAAKEGGEYVRLVVRHASPFASGRIFVAAVRSFYIQPDVEVVVPEWIVGRLREPYYPVFDKTVDKQINKPMYAVEVIEKNLSQYAYKNFLKEHASKIAK